MKGPCQRRCKGGVVMKSQWQSVIDVQDAALRFVHSEVGRAYGKAFGRSIIEKTDSEEYAQVASERGWDVPRPGEAHWAHGIPELLHVSLTLAEPIYVNEEVRDLIEAAAESWSLENLLASDIYPTLYGFVLFDRPFVIRDVHDKQLSFRALAWTPIDKDGHIANERWDGIVRSITPDNAGGILLTAFQHRDDPDDYPIGDLSDIGITSTPEMTLSYITPWHFDSPAPIDAVGAGLHDVVKITQVLWRIARQQITVDAARQLPRPERRRAARLGMASDVTVITLRHATHGDSNGNATQPGSVEYDHRWFVRGHWRNQWYPKLHTHRQIWISPYIKGPEDAPLKIKPLRAFELTR
jgi:hypothetical protein